MIWLWSTSCDLCGHRGRHYRWLWMAKFAAIVHNVTRHPYGHMRIPAVDKDTFEKNRR